MKPDHVFWSLSNPLKCLANPRFSVSSFINSSYFSGWVTLNSSSFILSTFVIQKQKARLAILLERLIYVITSAPDDISRSPSPVVKKMIEILVELPSRVDHIRHYCYAGDEAERK
jgi:hypothetical protein